MSQSLFERHHLRLRRRGLSLRPGGPGPDLWRPGQRQVDGGADFLADILRGEQGDDTFVRYARWNGLLYDFESENTDFNASGIDRHQFFFLGRVTRTR